VALNVAESSSSPLDDNAVPNLSLSGMNPFSTASNPPLPATRIKAERPTTPTCVERKLEKPGYLACY